MLSRFLDFQSLQIENDNMPRRKPKPEKIVERVVQENIKNTLDQILAGEGLDDSNFSTVDLPRMKSTEMLDFTSIKNEVGNVSSDYMTSIVDFYLQENIVEKSNYVKYKQKIDSMNLSSMMLQIKTAQHAINKLLEEIDLGNANPRFFEVLSQFQSQIMNMSRDYQNYLNKMEESYVKIRTEGEKKAYSGGIQMEYNSEDGTTSVNTENVKSEGIRTRGTKGLMEGLREILGTEIEDIKIDEIDENSIVNARKKEELSLTRNDIEVSEENSLDVDEDLFN